MGMDDLFAITRELADIQQQLIELPDDAFEQRYQLRQRQDELRKIARSADSPLDAGRSDAELLAELRALREQMKAIEGQRIDLVGQAGSGGGSSGEMGNLGGVKLNKQIDDAQGLGKVKARIGVIKGNLTDRGVAIPPPD
jgi:hypothetical protein